MSAKRKFFNPELEAENKPPFEQKYAIGTEGFEQAKRIEAPSGFISLATDIGVGREINEDALVLDLENNAFAVIDGMGGMGNGDLAAMILARELQREFTEKTVDIRRAQLRASEIMRERGVGEGGACYTAGIIQGRDLLISYAGDVELMVVSRTNKEIRFQIRPEGAGNIVFNAVQGIKAGRINQECFRLRNNDRIYLASDGLWANLTSPEIIEETTDKRPEVALQQLYELAISRMEEPHKGSPDNISIIIYDILFKEGNK